MALSLEHSALLLLFQNRPTLALELLRDALGVPVNAAEPALIESVDLTAALPAEYRADLVVRYSGGSEPLVIAVEVQLERDQEKRYSWPAYSALLRARFRCRVCLLVVAPRPSVARWCARPIDLGNGAMFTPVVLSAEAIPKVVDAAVARASPELSVLSALAHGGGDPATATAIGVAGLSALEGLETGIAMIYFDLISAALGEAARKAIEAMIPQGYKFQSEFALKHIAEGRAIGLKIGEAIGEARGEAIGEARAKANAVLTVLEVRGLNPSAEARARILACSERTQLDSWLQRAATATDSSELFE
ncbi:MAG TPA: hypothetical protein VJV79_32965 [Polyangiaceae bacterium]|nr:hypothetical protein [Polyangiaceae bacterium]